jgi:peptidoglycan/xylan/chitin deacetylase (PgdA/CDA1 family)
MASRRRPPAPAPAAARGPLARRRRPRPRGAPDHDLTARVERECYRALPAARVNDDDGRVRRLVDTLARASFDVAPALLGWLARTRPSTYAAILAADRAAVRRTGHGAALAHPYHHTILPLLSRRDQRTEVRWGLAEFRRRFGREAVGMWLPECAADEATLDVLAEAGVRFTVLAPGQLRDAREVGDAGAAPAADAAGEAPPAEGDAPAAPDAPPAADAAVDAGPARLVTTSGRALAVYTFDEALAHDVAFGGLLRDGRAWGARMRDAARARPGALVAVASGAEQFGHHHRFGDMALAAMFDTLAHPPAPPNGTEGPTCASRTSPRTSPEKARHRGARSLCRPVELELPHGLERWRGDCGCRRDASTHQRWRAPLRDALSGCATRSPSASRARAADLFAHVPGGADAVRDGYNDALPAARGAGDVLATAGGAVPPTRDPVWARELLDMEREALAMFDSTPGSATTWTRGRRAWRSPTRRARCRSPGPRPARSSAGCSRRSPPRRATSRRPGAPA